MTKKIKILVGLSGGVDSAVSLLLLKRQGFEVEAAFMKNFSDKVNIKGVCPWQADREEAYRVAAKLKVHIQTLDFQTEYHDKIVDYIFSSYKKGQTPNPDVLCNSEIKFKLFMDRALALGFDKIATGHYARIKQDKNGWHLLRGRDCNKDQSYFLANLSQNQLSKAIFPIGDMKKDKVRLLARQAQLPNADRQDSQGICFIGKVDLKTFLSQKIKPKRGNIVDTAGKKLGSHQGVWYYTIGQRKGLDLNGGPWYIASKDIATNTIVVAKADSSELYSDTVQIGAIHWLTQLPLPLKAQAQIRYRQKAQKVTLYEGRAIFQRPQKGVASGQTLAIYRKDELVASATIT